MRISDWSSDVCSSDLPCRWWLLPGNHDYARNGGLWDRVRHKASDNIILLTEPVAQEMEAGLWLLPAPLLHRHHLDDPTELFESMETPGAKLRRGLATGDRKSVVSGKSVYVRVEFRGRRI